MNVSERIIAIGGHNRSNDVIKRRYHRVVEIHIDVTIGIEK
jgi:predicted ABC-type ATPase